jgi:dTDP-4-dehydrorhamnose 3,5-epimerase
MDIKKIPGEGIYGLKLHKYKDFRGVSIDLPNQIMTNLGFNGVRSIVVNNLESQTLRGLHFQEKPFHENKIVMCVNGSVFDVLVNIESGSSEYLNCYYFNLGLKYEFQGIYVPDKYAHGYLTLEENTTLIYHFDKQFVEDKSTGIHWNSPSLNIPWPGSPKYISDKDSNLRIAYR